MPKTERVRIWDAGLRVFHWILVAVLTVSGITGFALGRTFLAWHLAAGAAVMIAIGWRLVWGLFGTTYARFSNFAYGPSAVLVHLVDMRKGRSHGHLGHNPLGAQMVFAMLAVLAAIGLSGIVTLGGMLKQGPMRAFLSYAVGRQILQVHDWLAILFLVMIAAHLAGVMFESWRGRENLVAAMVTGKKLSRPVGEPAIPVQARAGVVVIVTLAGLAAGVLATIVGSDLPARGVPPAELDPVFAEQCGACHLAYPPSLAPASTWNGILADLQHHFGADATLSADQIARIRGWLDTTSAERWDTLPSHILRKPAADGSLRITDTPGWRQRHRDIADATFSSKRVNGRSNCLACHSDAETGEFKPQDIAIPDGSKR